MKILILNNYDLEYILREWQQDGQAAHQIWGITQMDQYGIEADILPYQRFPLLKRLGHSIKVLGDLDQQLRVLTKSHNYDLIYSGHYFTTSLLALLRKLKLLNTPLVAIAFQAPKKGFLAKLYVNLFVTGNDKLICLSEGIKDHFEKEFNVSGDCLEIIEWGYDVSFHSPKPMDLPNVQKQGYIFSTGKSFRDYKTLIKAFSSLDYPLEIVGYSDNMLELLKDVPKNIDITIPLSAVSSEPANQSLRSGLVSGRVKTVERLFKTAEILAMYEKALAVAIPLDLPPNKPHNTVGLSSLLEAMCMGRAVITTENKDMGILLEKEGIGFTVPLHDVQAWKQATQYILDHPEEAKEMGQRARYLAETRYNLEHFTHKIAQSMKSIIG